MGRKSWGFEATLRKRNVGAQRALSALLWSKLGVNLTGMAKLFAFEA
jgi:hypothetical protein